MTIDDFHSKVNQRLRTIISIVILSSQLILVIVWAVHLEARITANEVQTSLIKQTADKDGVDIHELANRIDRLDTPLAKKVADIDVSLRTVFERTTINGQRLTDIEKQVESLRNR